MMITMTTMTKIKRDYHNDAKQVALGFVKNQSRIFCLATSTNSSLQKVHGNVKAYR